MLNTHCFMGIKGRISSTNNAALSTIRFAPQLGQKPRRLQLNASNYSCGQLSQRSRINPCSRRPHLAVYQYLQTKDINKGLPQFWLKKLSGTELSLPNGKNITYQLSENPKEMPILIMESESPRPAM